MQLQSFGKKKSEKAVPMSVDWCIAVVYWNWDVVPRQAITEIAQLWAERWRVRFFVGHSLAVPPAPPVECPWNNERIARRKAYFTSPLSLHLTPPTNSHDNPIPDLHSIVVYLFHFHSLAGFCLKAIERRTHIARITVRWSLGRERLLLSCLTTRCVTYLRKSPWVTSGRRCRLIQSCNLHQYRQCGSMGYSNLATSLTAQFWRSGKEYISVTNVCWESYKVLHQMSQATKKQISDKDKISKLLLCLSLFNLSYQNIVYHRETDEVTDRISTAKTALALHRTAKYNKMLFG